LNDNDDDIDDDLSPYLKIFGIGHTDGITSLEDNNDDDDDNTTATIDSTIDSNSINFITTAVFLD